jgi:hypothetical protein
MTPACGITPEPTDDDAPAPTGGGCPFSGNGGGAGGNGLSRRSFLKYGIGALASASALGGASVLTSGPAARAAKAVPATAAFPKNIPLNGTPRWKHAVGDPRGIDIGTAVGRTRQGRFGLMFPQLKPFAPDDDLLAVLATQMTDSRDPLPDVSDPTDGRDNWDIPSGYVYYGQFIDHDITHDTTDLTLQQQDPHALTNFDTSQFDLGSLYGRGPTLDPQLYDTTTKGAMALNEMGFIWDQGGQADLFDLPRAADGTAIVGDPRNDENLIVSQLQVAFLRLHNHFVSQGMTFDQARDQTRWHHQWVVVHDFLPRMVGQDLVDSLLYTKSNGTIGSKGTLYKPQNPLRPYMPVEYSAAAYRFGHSMIRGEYEVHDQLTIPIFGQEGHDLRGSRPFPIEQRIDWNYFFEIPGKPDPDDRNQARLIDTQLSKPLASLPPTVVAPAADAITMLAERNLLRGKRLGLPAGQDVAALMKVPVLSNADLGLTDPRWGGKAPLWFYILKESELLGGTKLGPVGARIVAETILGLLSVRSSSYFTLKKPFKPVAAEFMMGDLLTLAGAAPPGSSSIEESKPESTR